MIKKLSLLLILAVELITLRYWFLCQQFKSFIHLSSQNVGLRVDELIHNDGNTPLLLVRLLHNKIIVFILDIFRIYLQFWDIRFATNLFSIVGYFGIFCGFYYLILSKIKNSYKIILSLFLLLLPFVEIVFEPNLNFILKLFLLVLPYWLFSLFGIYQFCINGNRPQRVLIIGFLISLSLWWTVLLSHEIGNYCVL